jgi:hypothetical protein
VIGAELAAQLSCRHDTTAAATQDYDLFSP